MALNNTQYNTIMREYESLRRKSRVELEKRQTEVLNRIPAMKNLNTQAGRLALRYYREAMEKESIDVLDHFQREINYIVNEKERLLKTYGFPKDYLKPQYHCIHCQDTGYVEGKKCQCFRLKAIKLLYEQSHLLRVLEKENFNNFTLKYYDEKEVIPEINMTVRGYMERILRLCKEYIREFKQGAESLLFMGNTGVGKTFLSHCIAKELLDASYSVLYFSAMELFDIMGRERFRRDYEQEEVELGEDILECDLLIIDDLGTEMANSFTMSQLFHIINKRQIYEKPTIISTNLNLSAMREIYTERVTSRIMSKYMVIRLYGEDIRKKL